MIYGTMDAREAMQAYLDRRKPEYTGGQTRR
jgi:hypothetical protein